MTAAPPTVLLIDDDPGLLDLLGLAFEDAGFAVLTADNGLRGLARALEDGPALIVSDVNMPGLDGFSLCRRLREDGHGVPLILLTSRDDEIDEALGLELGADDYVAKPFSTRVLLARARALLRREAARSGAGSAGVARAVADATGGAPAPPRDVGALRVDAERIELHWQGDGVTVTVTEFRLVETLTERPGVVLSRERLLAAVRDDDSVVAHRIIDTYVRRLRRKFEAIDGQFDRIETVIGAGYRWRD